MFVSGMFVLDVLSKTEREYGMLGGVPGKAGVFLVISSIKGFQTSEV